MHKLNFILVSSTILTVVLSVFLSDGVKVINFTKTTDESDEYEFEYRLETGDIFRGRTFILNEYIYVMFGADNEIYWVEFTKDELTSNGTFSKIVRLVERRADVLILKNDFIQYQLTISRGLLFVTPYPTLWDLKQICFTKCENGNQTLFKYTIPATNNSRFCNGTTKYELDDPHLQHIHIDDVQGVQCHDVYQVEFKDDELKTNETFCKGFSKSVSHYGISAAYSVCEINPALLKALSK